MVMLPPCSSCSKLEAAVRKLTEGSGVISEIVPSPCPLMKSANSSAAVKQTSASATSMASNMISRLPTYVYAYTQYNDWFVNYVLTS